VLNRIGKRQAATAFFLGVEATNECLVNGDSPDTSASGGYFVDQTEGGFFVVLGIAAPVGRGPFDSPDFDTEFLAPFCQPAPRACVAERAPIIRPILRRRVARIVLDVLRV
jgi:hypothetical protein